ncbi:aerobic cobaltochelatase CobT subunit (plasmid) [Photobacterium sp. DA100]|uniref:cobaltochelatase CobT-related protein n=1 Tax=Photobacterium sp. DA100 TaxID=3027472 RepID=UPI002479AA53|nr:aerobic cobaltochelatase CobT subunit [Photobacterium sp. DA100]WEM44194.1 aerobic cobaltochelatase CobT subunit [Photobacterium sp. DA100]
MKLVSTANKRERQKNQQLQEASARALSEEPKLHYRGESLYVDNEFIPVYAAHLRNASVSNNHSITEKRGKIDAISLRLRYSDYQLHKQLYSQLGPDEPITRLLLEALEQLRCESYLGDDHIRKTLPGVCANVEHNFAEWSRQFYQSGLADTHIGMLLFTVVQVVRSRLHTQAIDASFEDFIEATRAGIVPIIGEDLAGLRRHRRNQHAYALHAISLGSIISEMIESEQNQADPTDESRVDQAKSVLSFLLNFDQGEEIPIATAQSGQSKAFNENHNTYRVFTTHYDREVQASKLVRKALLVTLREELDERIQQQGINIKQLSRQLSALLSSPQRDGWIYGEEEGYIDGRRLSQLVSSPNENRIFGHEYYHPIPNSIVSFLIDCSGSMREHINHIAILIDTMVKALGLTGIRSEVLGFTTNSWNGGKAYSDWLRQRKPAYPGRLNENCHLIFKPAESHWRHTRKDIAALLKADLFKEGIDGEAVLWACKRLIQRQEPRKLLFVISDGCPMDTTTNLANDKFYLDNHLKQVIAQYQANREVEIIGLGVGLDLSPYYRQSLALDFAESSIQHNINEIIALLSKSRRKT